MKRDGSARIGGHELRQGQFLSPRHLATVPASQVARHLPPISPEPRPNPRSCLPTMKPGSARSHTPVLLDEVIEHLACAPGKCFVDGTIGGGGHAGAILELTAPNGRLVGIDWDEEALAIARGNLRKYGERLILVRDNFARIPAVLANLGVEAVDGILLDLGLSAFHVDSPERGFSFSHPGPLDMRMDTRREQTAAHLVNTLTEEELAQLIRRFGEERWSRRIARNIVRSRIGAAITTTDRLAELVVTAIPAGKRSRLRHPATRTFQALRLAVNEELDNLQTFLNGALDCLRPGGRLAVITFHSLEDRLVKQTFADWARACRCPADWPVCRCQASPLAKRLVKKSVVPGPEEVDVNPRARSARLRVAEKLEAA
jgi:16S rRNA (cytosine1402-N4)-methyltransferase